jgi:hypothetical protein
MDLTPHYSYVRTATSERGQWTYTADLCTLKVLRTDSPERLVLTFEFRGNLLKAKSAQRKQFKAQVYELCQNLPWSTYTDIKQLIIQIPSFYLITPKSTEPFMQILLKIVSDFFPLLFVSPLSFSSQSSRVFEVNHSSEVDYRPTETLPEDFYA